LELSLLGCLRRFGILGIVGTMEVTEEEKKKYSQESRCPRSRHFEGKPGSPKRKGTDR